MPRSFQLKEGAEFHARSEVPISKGTGSYQTTIGFVDVLLFVSVLEPKHTSECGYQRCSCRGVSTCGHCTCLGKTRGDSTPEVIIEVKTSEVSPGEALRQIGLYREYLGALSAVLAVTFDPSEVFVTELRAADIQVVKLGKGFEAWLGTKKHCAENVLEL